MLADSDLLTLFWGELLFMAAFLGSRARHPAISTQFPYKTLRGTEHDLNVFQLIGAKAFVRIETHAKKLEFKAVEGHLVEYSNNGKS